MRSFEAANRFKCVHIDFPFGSERASKSHKATRSTCDGDGDLRDFHAADEQHLQPADPQGVRGPRDRWCRVPIGWRLDYSGTICIADLVFFKPS